MCGIVALYTPEADAIDRALLERMGHSLRHRGPDECGYYHDRHVGLGHQRLSVIDLSTGQQPMRDASGRLWISYNGEIYNFLELRDELAASGYSFRTRSDTEVILALYERDGEDFVERLNGIFTIALWDAREEKLVLVRDRLGVKPLYLWQKGGRVAAASEIKALLLHPGVGREVRCELIPEYLAYRQLADGRTLFRDVETIAPGEIVTVRNGTVRRRCYWELPPSDESPELTDAELVDRLDELLRDATHMQLVSDVPIGTFASGGIDSSLVTGYAAEKSGEHLETFCIGIEEPQFDERYYSELVAKQYRSDHHVFLVRQSEIADALPDVVWHHDQPLSHPNTLALYFLSQLAKQQVTVVLTGEGCDEFFGGYPRYRLAVGLERMGPVGRWVAGALARGVSPGSLATRRGKLVHALREGLDRTVVEASRYVSEKELGPLLDGDLSSARLARAESGSGDGGAVARILRQDQRNYLEPILMRLDRASMAFGLEARVPFLDHRIVEFAARVPSRLKVSLRENKILVKRVASRRLPREVVYRKKSGLALPLESWLREPEQLGRYLEMLLEPRSRQRPYLDGPELERAVLRHKKGEANHADLLWALLNLEVWQRVMVEGEGRGSSRESASAATIPAGA